MLRTYSELAKIDDYHERFRYLALSGVVGACTFGHKRPMNQEFYHSREWKQARDIVIVRDNGCDLGVEGYEIHSRLLIHHMNPIVSSDLIHRNPDIFDPEFLITTTHDTHNAIHYGDERQLPRPLADRFPGDTRLW